MLARERPSVGPMPDTTIAGKIYIKLNDGRVGGDVTTLFPSPRNAGRSGGGDRRSLSGRLLARARRVKQQPADQHCKNNRAEHESIFAFQRGFGV
jgi:hypothetical protein